MPNRILKESICASENIDQLSAFEETCFYRLIVNCDDFGRMDARPRILASRLFPLRDVTTDQIEAALRALTAADLIFLYTAGGKPYLQMRTWDRHQQIRARKSKFPEPEDDGLHLISNDINCNQMISNDINCPRNPIQSNTNPNPNAREETDPQTRFSPHSVDEVREYCRERGNRISAERFVSYYEARGWRGIVDWRACVRAWEQRDRQPSSAKQVSAQMYGQRDYTGEDSLSDVEDVLRGEMKA